MILGSISAISSSQNVLNFPPFCTSGWKSFFNLVPRALGCRRSFYWGSSGAHLGEDPLIFRPNWGPKGEKVFETDPPPSPPPPPYLRVWMIGSSLIWGSGSATDPVLLASFSFPMWLWTLKDRFNKQRHSVDKTRIKSKPTAFSEHSVLTLTILTLTCS